jgi:hypothetical protein
MGQSSSQPTIKTSSLVPHSASAEPQCGVLGASTSADDYQRIPDADCSFDEVALWEEFDVQKYSAEYHLGKYFEYWDRCRDANGGSAVLSDCKGKLKTQDLYVNKEAWTNCMLMAILTQRDEGLSNQKNNKDRWRLKIQHDKIIRDLLRIQGILNMLVADEERITGSRCLKKALAWFVMLLFSLSAAVPRNGSKDLVANRIWMNPYPARL